MKGDISMNHYKITARFAFDGSFIVSADSFADARKIVSDSCGLTIGSGIHTTLPDEEIDWEFPVHPEMSILHACLIAHPKDDKGENNGKLS